MPTDIQPKSPPPTFRRLWVVVLLTCLLLTFPIAMIILFTGEVYKRAKDGSLIPIKNATRYVYACLLALWLVAAVLNSIVNPDTWKQDLAGLSTANSSAVPQTVGNDANVPDKCDSSDAADMVKGALEGSAGSRIVAITVEDFGHAQETYFDAAHNSRHCQAEAVLNTGDRLVTYQLFYGPSGKELVQVEQGQEAEQQAVDDRNDKAGSNPGEGASRPANGTSTPSAPDPLAARYSPEFIQCMNSDAAAKGDSNAQFLCLNTESNVQQKKLEDANQAALGSLDPDKASQLTAAQAAWTDSQSSRCPLKQDAFGATDYIGKKRCELQDTMRRTIELENIVPH